MELFKVILLPLLSILRDPAYLIPPLLPASAGLVSMTTGHTDQRALALSLTLQTLAGLFSSTIIISMAPKGYRGEPSSIGKALVHGVKVYPRVLATFAVIFVGAMVGFLLFIIPGVVVLVLTFFAFQEVILAQKQPIQSIRESMNLVKAYPFSVSFVFLYLTSIALLLEGGANRVSPFASFAATLLVSPYITLAITYAYLEIKEGEAPRASP